MDGGNSCQMVENTCDCKHDRRNTTELQSLKNKVKKEEQAEILALDLHVDPLQMLLQSSRTLFPLTDAMASHVHARVTHAQTHASVGSETEKEAYFSVPNGGKYRKRERGRERRRGKRGDYNLIRGRKSWSNPPEVVEMPPCWRLLHYRLTELHLNGLLWHGQRDRQPKSRQ